MIVEEQIEDNKFILVTSLLYLLQILAGRTIFSNTNE